MKTARWTILLCLLLLTACSNTEEVTEAPPTEPVTEEVTEPETEEVTEPETEPETEAAAEPERMFSERYPIAVMVDNHPDALPQSGLQNAEIIYEMQVEGRLTRLLVVTDEDAGEIGPVRSARPAFLNFVAEHEAFYLHVGNFEYVQASPIGDRIKDMDQFLHAGGAYYRVDRKVPPHNMYADIGALYAAAEQEDYELNPAEEYGYLRSPAAELPEGEPGESVALTYDEYLYQRYEFEEEKNGYVKFINDEPVVDEQTDEPLVITSYILLQLDHTLMENNVHFSIADVGEGESTLYNGGRQIPITWEREANGEPMVFQIDGEEIVFPDGLLYIQIIPEWVQAQ